MAKIVFIVPYSKYYINFSWDLLKSLINEGNEITALAPDDSFHEELAAIGVKLIKTPLNNTGLNIFYDIYSLYMLVKRLKSIEPHLVMCYSLKPILYGTYASRLAKVKSTFSFVTGIGYVFIGNTFLHKILLTIVKILYKFSLKYSNKVFFENPDDLSLFKSLRLLGKENEAVIVNGSGVDINKFTYSPPKVNPISFLVISRIIFDKGILEFIEAAKILKQKYPQIKFKILGPFVKNPSSIKKEIIHEWVNQGVIEYLGETTDVRPFIADSSVFVLPSYREGTPKSTLEAMAMGLPVVTTDCPGCRETVQNNVNGFLIPAKDCEALAMAMEKFIINPSIIPIMGIKSREIAVRKYDVRKVNHFIKKNIGLE
ncbi:glycosyltransferase family 4 protein [Paenibacillus sp. V4I5]|uniref:glycosyltransferase family 4 protein n=1 Tax=Paenibacillus sp. V4I5 TaxID=3042306 RepID=UPI0027900C60|nr:glycosyltransferase family 4 protein [Paenibacillus sp. V4I5]MDQ0917491.1 glycosyltransferase involved in cell wall biosynthesis [Paenibacillus sp. V4I5]